MSLSTGGCAWSRYFGLWKPALRLQGLFMGELILDLMYYLNLNVISGNTFIYWFYLLTMYLYMSNLSKILSGTLPKLCCGTKKDRLVETICVYTPALWTGTLCHRPVAAIPQNGWHCHPDSIQKLRWSCHMHATHGRVWKGLLLTQGGPAGEQQPLQAAPKWLERAEGQPVRVWWSGSGIAWRCPLSDQPGTVWTSRQRQMREQLHFLLACVDAGQEGKEEWRVLKTVSGQPRRGVKQDMAGGL